MQVVVTGNKFNDKLYRRHTTGRPGSMKIERFKDLQAVSGVVKLVLYCTVDHTAIDTTSRLGQF